MKLPSRPVRFAVMSAAFMVLYKARVDAASLKKAVSLSNDAHHVLIASVIAHVEKNMASWLDMLGSMNSILDESHFAKVPTLFSVGASANHARVRFDRMFVQPRDWALSAFELVGTDAIASSSGWWPSDHFGVLLCMVASSAPVGMKAPARKLFSPPGNECGCILS